MGGETGKRPDEEERVRDPHRLIPLTPKGPSSAKDRRKVMKDVEGMPSKMLVVVNKVSGVGVVVWRVQLRQRHVEGGG